MKLKAIFIVAALTLFLSGCSLFEKPLGVYGKASIAEDKAKAKIELIDSSTANVNVERLDKIGAFSSGVAYSLSKDTNNSPAVLAAKDLNERVMALANKPDFKEAQAIASLVDQLITNQAAGEKALAAKDKEVESLTSSMKDLSKQKDDALNQYYNLANATAAKEDATAQTLKQMDSWLGLGAVWYGLHKFIISSMWILGIGSLVFLILRLLASSNPIAASIFSIFEQMGSWAINTIGMLLPKAIGIAGNVATSAYNDVKSGLTKVVDAVETVKLQQAASGTPATIQDLLDAAEASMTPADKALIDKIKLELGWVKPSVKPTVVVTPPTPVPVVAPVAQTPTSGSAQ